MFGRLYEKHLDGNARFENLISLLIAANPITLLVTVPGIVYLFSNNKSINRPLVMAITLSYLLLLISNGKSYYFYPFILILLPFGGVFWEQFTLEKRKWLIYPLTVILIFGSVLIPFGMPVYSFKRYLSTIYKYEKKDVKDGTLPIRFDEYYTKNKWKNTLTELKSVYDSLPLLEKEKCAIWGKHYGQAGAVNLFGADYGLPNAFSLHGSFYSWLPNGKMAETTIVLCYDVGDFFDAYFDEVIQVRTIYNPYAEAKEELYQKIYICKKPKQDFSKLKEIFKNRIFE
jgi:hypothetical protein